jgi:pectin methylesterase-like acyl-CoA thioesterase
MATRGYLAVAFAATLAFAACATSDDTNVTGTGGSSKGGTTGSAGATGAAGNGSGTAGTGGASSGSAGTGTPGSAGTMGTAGASATAGTSGSAGNNGTAGAAGNAGANGTAGVTGTAGGGGTTGAAGNGAAGRGGTTGAGGNAGATGAAGRGGTTGQGGSAGRGGMAGSAAGAGGSTAGRGGTTGTAGTTGQGGQGNLPPGVTSLFPPPNGQNLCPDPPLKITFSGTPTLGSSGRFRVFTSGGSAVATVDMAASTVTETIGGMSFAVSRPVYVDGNTVSVTLPPKALSYGMTYYVNVESGAITANGGAFSITDTTTWRFTTMAAAPSNKTALSVALDGSGSFCSVQGAFDLVPSGNTAATTIAVGAGHYHEVIRLNGKSAITLQGADRNGTVISGTNNNNLNPSTKGRSLFGVDSLNNFTIRNLTIQNLTPQGGSQAEALRMEGCDKCVVRDATVISLQDTLLWSGRIYASNVLIEGNVDFIWGTGAAYFANSEIRTLGRKGYIVQSRNSSGYGYVFVDCKLTADSGITGNILARIDAGAYPSSHVAYINCQMSNAIDPTGWLLTAGSATSSLRFWEYKSVDASGNAINVSSRLSGSRQLSDSEAAMMRDPTVVLNGWQPPAN